MKIKNIEFKARVESTAPYEEMLLKLAPRFEGEDHQTDTYYEVPQGRLKLREGNIETALIFYEREDSSGARQSDVLLYKHEQGSSLKQILAKLHKVKATVRKNRRIYFINNVKFHFDEVEGLGRFMEVEAIDETGEIGLDRLREQCDNYLNYFGLHANQLETLSYSDMLLMSEDSSGS